LNECWMSMWKKEKILWSVKVSVETLNHCTWSYNNIRPYAMEVLNYFFNYWTSATVWWIRCWKWFGIIVVEKHQPMKPKWVEEGVGQLPTLGNILLVAVIFKFLSRPNHLCQLFHGKLIYLFILFYQNSSFFIYK
jgi:hypothetical protein